MAKPSKTTSFALGEDLDAFVRERVKSGEFASASEVLREALTKFRIEHEREAAFYAAIDRGVESGRGRTGAFARVRKRLRKRLLDQKSKA